MTEIARTEDGAIMLSTGLDEVMFAKTKCSLLMAEPGFMVELDAAGTVLEFTPWTFSGTKSSGKGEDVLFCGDRFSGRTLSSLLALAYGRAPKALPAGAGQTEGAGSEQEPEQEQHGSPRSEPARQPADSGGQPFAQAAARAESKRLLAAVCAAYTAAVGRNVPLPCNSPGGILYEFDGCGGTRLLFLPEKTFDRACANRGTAQYAAFQDCWRDSIAERRQAQEFACAVCAYFALADELPYPPQGGDGKDAQTICDRNFLPIEYCVNGIDAALADAIDTALRGAPLKSPFPLEALRKELLSGEERIPALPEAEFRRAAQEFRARQRTQVARRKRFRRHFAAGAAAAAAAVLAAVIAASIFAESGKKPTVIGLDSAAVTEVFYTGLHQMDTDFMLAAAKDCPEAQRYISQVPQIFVTGQMRSAYNFESGVSTPENWMFFEPDSTRAYSHLIYGITNFSLDGQPSILDAAPPTRRSHPPKLVREGTERLVRTSAAEHTARYYLVHTVDNWIHAEEFTTRVELKWTGDRWQIGRLGQASSTDVIHPAIFSTDLKEALASHGGDVIAAVQSLRERYPWVPTAASLEAERTRLDALGY
ncbi:MAG: hypothetical protein K2H09_04565 [Treponemataceae bacterium]|nr:hypothetical protein [Treponemataceae bacterium]